MPAADLVAFDLYGTLLDVAGLAEQMPPIAGQQAAELLGRWRKAQLERSWRLNRDGSYEPWDRVTLEALMEVAPDSSSESREMLARLWLTVPAFTDARATLQALKSAGVPRAVLSNGTRRMIVQALEAASLDVDTVLSADDVKAYKPDARVYALLDATAGRGRALFVTANGWDADGAKRAGLSVVWIDRGGEPPETAPSHRVASLTSVADLVLRFLERRDAS